MTYTDLIFDLYGTLVDIHTDEHDGVWEKTALFLSFHGARCTGMELKSHFLFLLDEEKKAAKKICTYPDIPFERIMAQVLHDFGVKENIDTLAEITEQLFRIFSIEYIRLYPGVKEALQKLREHGHRLWLLTNAQRVFTWNEICMLGLDSLFDGIYISSDYGCRKPDPLFFHALLENENLDPAQCLMIGNDRDTDITGAKSVGISTLYMHTNLTPANQEEASPALHPAVTNSGHYEYEGWDWNELEQLISAL